MDARLVLLENRLKQTEEVLVMERLAERFAESAHQMVGTKSAGVERSLGPTSLVGARETGEPPMSSGESGLSSQVGSITLHLWSVLLSNKMVTGFLRNVGSKGERSSSR